MLDTANHAIRQASEADERRRREEGRRPALMSALDDLLFELEELTVRGVAVAPAPCRKRAAELIAVAAGRNALLALPDTVARLMERVYDAQDVALNRRRRAGP